MPDRRTHRGPHPEDARLFATEALGALRGAAADLTWLLDRPVSNSGRLKQIILEIAAHQGWPWTVELVAAPDPLLAATTEIVATADSVILDRCGPWLNLARQVVETRVTDARYRSFPRLPSGFHHLTVELFPNTHQFRQLLCIRFCQILINRFAGGCTC